MTPRHEDGVRAIALPQAAILFLKIPPSLLASAEEAIEEEGPPCPLRVKRVGFVMSQVCPVYPKQQTFPDSVGTSHLGQKRPRAGCES